METIEKDKILYEDFLKIKEENKRLKIIQYLISSMNEAKDSSELLSIMLDKSIAILGADTGSIMLGQENTDELKYEVYRGFNQEVVAKTKIKIGEGVTGNVFRDGIPRLVNDVENNPIYISLRDDIKSELAVPLLYQGKIFGVLSVDSKKKNAFKEEDVEFLQTIASQATQILIRKNLIEELKKKIEYDEFLIEISQTLETINDLNKAFDVLMLKLNERFNIMRGMLVLFEKDSTEKLQIINGFRMTKEEISKGKYKSGEGVIGHTVKKGEPIVIKNIHTDKLFLNKTNIKRDKSKQISFLSIPIKIDGIIAGVLAVEKEYISDKILEEEKQILSIIANFISIKVKTYYKLMEEKESLIYENINLKKKLNEYCGFDNIIGENKKMLELFELIKIVSESSSSVLIRGESGTGKELVAKAIHYNSPRKDHPFISINCAAIPENLLESELFGYKKGAFTGAVSDRKGKFLLANEGTLFLDEIGDMPLFLQAKILRAIQEKEIEPIGSDKPIKVNVRIISATNKNLETLVKENKFREDLYYRLNVIEISIPPLRERIDDIPLLVHHFIKKYNERENKHIKSISNEALRQLQLYHWPGNVRELENIIERAVLISKSDTIESYHLPDHIINYNNTVNEIQVSKWIENMINNTNEKGIYFKILKFIETEIITKALMKFNKNKVKVSDFLGINRNTLRSKMKEYNIDL